MPNTADPASSVTPEPGPSPGPEADDVEETSIGRKAAGGFVWALLGFAFMQVGSFATYAYASRVLGADGIGVVGTALTLVFWIDVLLSVGLGASLIYEQETGQTHRVTVAFTVNLIMAVTLGSLMFFGADAIDSFFQADHPEIFRVLAFLILLKGLGQVPDAMLKRDLDFRRRIRADFTRSIGRLVVTVALLQSGMGPVAMVIGVLSAEVAAVAITWWLVRFVPRLAFDFKVAGQMLRFGAAMFGAQLLGMLWLQGDYFFITRAFGAKSDEFGSYYTAFRLPELVLGSVYNLFSNVAFPAFSAARVRGMEELRAAALRSLRYLCLFGFTAGIGMSLIARDFVGVVFGEIEGAIPIMQLLCVAAGFVAVGYASGDIYAAIGKPRLGVYFQLVFVPVLFIGFAFAIPHGVQWIAFVHVVVMIPYSLFRIEVANRLIGTTWGSSLNALRPALAATVGLVALALPVRLVTAQGFGSLVAILVAGLVGAVGGLYAGDRATANEVMALGGKVKARFVG